MTRFKRKPSKLFIKYLISYLAILLVPLLIIGFFGYSYIKSIDAEKVIDVDVDSLTEAVKTVDNYLEQISRNWGMHLTGPTTRCSISGWRTIRDQS